MPPATIGGLIVNVGAGEPVTPVNVKLYGWPTVAPVGVPVKFGADADRVRELEVEEHLVAGARASCWSTPGACSS